jgi:hypothetical protein
VSGVQNKPFAVREDLLKGLIGVGEGRVDKHCEFGVLIYWGMFVEEEDACC